MSTYDILTLITSILAIAVSTTSLVRSRTVAAEQGRLAREQLNLAAEQFELNKKLAEEQLKINEVTAQLTSYQLKEIEEQERLKTTPNLNVRFSKLGNRSDLVIANTGQGSAYNVDVELIDCKDSPLINAAQILPHPEIRPNSVLKIMAAFHMGSPQRYQIKVTWKDSGGEQSYIFWVNANS